MERVHNFNAGPAILPLSVLEQARDEMLNYRGSGLEAIARGNAAKAAKVYRAIDDSGGFYRGHARPDSRSRMNVTFRLPSEELERIFAKESEAQGLVGLKGHRSVGGLRASLYNALPIELVEALTQFMGEFQRKNG